MKRHLILNRTFSFQTGLTVLLLLCSLSVQAVVHEVSGGQLTGAKNVLVDVDGDPNTASLIFDVEFVDGTFATVFNSTIPSFHQSEAAAIQFGNALFDQVFVDIPNGLAFDSSPELTTGCTSTTSCIALIPFNVQFYVNSVRVNNTAVVSDSAPFAQVDYPDINKTNDSGQVWARFAPSQASVAAVPEPSTYAMLLAGLGLLGFAKRRQSV